MLLALRGRERSATRLTDHLRSKGQRPEAGAFLETVEFTAVDFLADDRERDAEIHTRFGPQVALLVRRDRQQNVRRAFRSFPLHELPLAARTINPFSLYENYLAGGRLILVPLGLACAAWDGRYRSVSTASTGSSTRSCILRSTGGNSSLLIRTGLRCARSTGCASLCSWGRSGCERASTWNTWGCALPSAPAGIAAHSLMETDLDYIGATRRDRIIAEQVRRQHQRRLEWVNRWLDRFGWTFEMLPQYLTREIPFLANRGGEALRALVAACILDHDDIATLALSIEGLKRLLAHASDPTQDLKKLAVGTSRSRRQPQKTMAPGQSMPAPDRRPVRVALFPRLQASRATAGRPLPAPASPGRQRLDQGGARSRGQRSVGRRESTDEQRAAANRPLERSNPRLAGGPEPDDARPATQL